MLRKSSVPKISELDVSINHTGTSLNVSLLDTSTLLYVSIDHTLSMLKVSVAYPKAKQKVIIADKKATLKVSIADRQATLQVSIAFLISHTTTTLLIGNWAGLACYFYFEGSTNSILKFYYYFSQYLGMLFFENLG